MEKKEKNKFSKLIVVSIIISLIIEFILTKSNVYFSISIARIITIFGLTSFVFSHFVFGFKKVWYFIVDKRYKISFYMIILSTIIGFFQNNITLKEWLLETDVVLCLWWNIKFYALMLVSYELFLILTEKNRNLSIIGTIVVTFSGFVAWNFAYIEPLILGELIVVLINKILVLESKKYKIFCMIFAMISTICYTFTVLDYAIAFGYIFLALIIWILIKNRKDISNQSINKILLIVFFILSIIEIIILKNIFKFSINYTVNSNLNGFSELFSYLSNILLPFAQVENLNYLGSFISIFPIPMLFALYYLYKNDNHIEFLLPITITLVFETIYCISGFPDIIEKITLFGKINPSMCVPAVNFANLLIIFYVLQNINEKVFKFTTTIRISIILTCLCAIIQRPEIFSSTGYLYLYVVEFCLLTFLFLNIDDRKYKNTFIFFLVLITLIGGITVNPIIKDSNISIEHKIEEKIQN
ncbi:MAG TPA: hypothetical protein IAD08_00885 [Candidatus Scatovivens faecipullorum]|nr:hypothetical protein [Candidatus Scatovivens faecipullorum]